MRISRLLSRFILSVSFVLLATLTHAQTSLSSVTGTNLSCLDVETSDYFAGHWLVTLTSATGREFTNQLTLQRNGNLYTGTWTRLQVTWSLSGQLNDGILVAVSEGPPVGQSSEETGQADGIELEIRSEQGMINGVQFVLRNGTRSRISIPWTGERIPCEEAAQ